MYTFFDVETPNARNDRICSIGIIQTDDTGHEIARKSCLVNPECSFDSFNISIHHITEDMCAQEPDFAEIWTGQLRGMFEGSCLVAHNATFDLNVLSKTLTSYGLDVPDIVYICTLQTLRRSDLRLSSNKLTEACRELGLPDYNAHDALADTEACCRLFWKLHELGIEVSPKHYVGSGRRGGLSYKQSTIDNDRAISKAMTELHGILYGIIGTGVLSPSKYDALKDWCDAHKVINDHKVQSVIKCLRSIDMQNRAAIPMLEFFMEETEDYLHDFRFSDSSTAFQELKGILSGLQADDAISLEEARLLHRWLLDNAVFLEDETAAGLLNTLDEFLSDGQISVNEEHALLGEFDRILNPASQGSAKIDFSGNVFCLTGNFQYGPKGDVEAYIIDKGGTISKNMTMKVRYLVLGGLGNEKYAFGNYGSKAKRALELQQKGKDVEIVTEDDLFNS
ncbi:MAG: hypothetical protein LUB61_01540 [Eggerthellaceae bacterium]|nr:hypothetical protein [Eggerthellaceae bacterium]